MAYGVGSNIQVIDKKTSESKYVFAGSEIVQPFEPMSKGKRRRFDYAARKDFVWKNPLYLNFKYDPYNQLYYRIAQKPVKEKHLQDAKTGDIKREETVIILDEKFNKVGEVKLEFDKYQTFEMIVTKHGLLIPLKK